MGALVIILLVMSSSVSTLSKSSHTDEDKMDFDFDFDWDEKPPDFISQLDLEVKWEDENEEPSKVSIKNVKMGDDYMTGPMTKLIETVANKSYESHNVQTGSCSCEEVREMIKVIKMEPVPKVKGEEDKKRRCKRCKGEKGSPGLSIQGPKGEPGNPGILPYHLLHPEKLKGEKGEKGPQGPPGYCSSTCQNSRNSWGPTTTKKPEMMSLTKPNYRIVPGALVFKSINSMFQMSTYVMVGSVVFVEDKEEFYGKMKSGWRKFQMGPIVTA